MVQHMVKEHVEKNMLESIRVAQFLDRVPSTVLWMHINYIESTLVNDNNDNCRILERLELVKSRLAKIKNMLKPNCPNVHTLAIYFGT